VKKRDLERHLVAHGCVLAREASKHELWENTATGQRTTVPGTERSSSLPRAGSAGQLGVPPPAEEVFGSSPKAGLAARGHLDGTSGGAGLKRALSTGKPKRLLPVRPSHPSLSVQSNLMAPEWGSMRYLSGLARS
jgi:hypothetical protein